LKKLPNPWLMLLFMFPFMPFPRNPPPNPPICQLYDAGSREADVPPIPPPMPPCLPIPLTAIPPRPPFLGPILSARPLPSMPIIALGAPGAEIGPSDMRLLFCSIPFPSWCFRLLLSCPSPPRAESSNLRERAGAGMGDRSLMSLSLSSSRSREGESSRSRSKSREDRTGPETRCCAASNSQSRKEGWKSDPTTRKVSFTSWPTA
jgi:hypothetical protein